ncbi:MAG: hypothetical protein WD794_14315 [Mycobacteriales bacterium]
MSALAATRVLAAVVALQLVAETALTPYWPQLLEELFGTAELGATGAYLTACRIAGLAALPLWALAARRWSLPRLLVVALLGSAVLDLTVALAPTLLLFTLASAGSVATGSALVLAYPALVAVTDRPGRGDRLGAVLVGVAVFHGASLLATVLGAGVLALPAPRLGLATFAVADLLLAVLVWRRVAVPATAQPGGAAAVPAAQPGGAVAVPAAAPQRGSLPPRQAALALPVVVVLLLAVLSDTGTGVPRPFFTALVLDGGGSLSLAAVLFLLPSAGALLVLPYARRLQAGLGDRLLPYAAGLAAVALALQAMAPAAVPVVGASRLALGAGFGLLAVALDLRVFAAVGTGGPGFALVETARSAALLASPLIATATATVDLALPLAAGAALLAATALVAAVAPRPSPVQAPEVDHVPEPAH